MLNMNWNDATSQQRGQTAEYYAKMLFTSYGWEVYTSEVDDHGVDFVAKKPGTKTYYEIQVKSLYKSTYAFIPEEKFELSDTRYMCLIKLKDNCEPDVYLIPGTAWEDPQEPLIYRPYDKPGQKSKPEYGVNASEKNMPLLAGYKAETMLPII